MLKKILALGMMFNMVNAGSAKPVMFNDWSEKGRKLVIDIVRSEVCDELRVNPEYNLDTAIQLLKPKIDALKPELNTLFGGAVTIYDRLIDSWSTGDEVWDYVPDSLGELAEKIYLALMQP